jgi:branched-chain amino acid transport system permease protein
MTTWLYIEPILCQVGILAILAMSLNMICGLTGLLQLGHAGFYAIGAYVAGLYSIYLTDPSLGWLNFAAATLAGMTAAMVFALVVGVPCLGLRGDYLAIVTLAFGEIVRLLLTNISFPGGRMFPGARIGGPIGISFTERPEHVWPDHPGYSAEYGQLWVIGLAVILTYVILLNIKRSSIGRAFMCIREDEIVARSMGVHVPRYKITAFLLSAAFAGLAGSLFFHQQLLISPSNFTLLKSIEVLLIVVLGGMGSLLGSVMAAVVLGLSPHLLRRASLAEYDFLPDVFRTPLSEYYMILYALLLIVLIRLTPEGILGMNELPAWLRTDREPRRKEGSRG